MAVLHLAWRELRSIFATGRAWWVVMLWLLCIGLLWYGIVNNYALQSQDLIFNPYAASMLTLGDYVIAPFFGNMLIICLLLGPVIAAGMFTEEYKQKTIELLLTSPIRTWEIVAGKYLGGMGFVAVLLLSTAHVPISLYQFGDPDWGFFVGGYLMLAMVLSVVVSLTLLCSSFTESQMVALFMSMVGCLSLVFISWLSNDPDGIIAQLSIVGHTQDVVRGSVRLSDLAWFGTATLFFLFATQQRLESFPMELISRWAWALGLAGVLALIGGVGLGWAYGGVEGTPRALLVAGAVLLFLYAFFDRESLSGTVQSRTFQHGTGSSLLVILAAVAAVATYALAKQNDNTWDLTRERSYTLSTHSIQAVQGLEERVEVLAFFRQDVPEQRAFRGLMERMLEHSDKLDVRYIDPLRQPRLAEEHEVTSETGTVILRTADDRTQRLDVELTESAFVQRLVLLLSREEHRVCWAMGHGEPDPDDEFSDRGLGVAVIQLEELNYQVTREVVPTVGMNRDCDAWVIARPTVEWQPWEREALAATLAEGGRVLMLLEPDSPPDLADELLRYGLSLRPDLVLDLNPENQLMGVDDPSFVVLHGANLLSHPITASLAAAVVLPIARSIEPRMDVEGLAPQRVMQTSRDAWGETSMDPSEMPQPNPGLELVGEVPVMAVSVIDDPSVLEVAARDDGEGRAVPEDFAPVPGGRLVVIGDSDFIANGYIALGNNRDLFLNSIAWLVEEEAQIGERPVASEAVTIDGLSAAFLCLVSVIFLPGAAGLLALVTWYRRRRL